VRCDSLSLYVVLRFRRLALKPTSCPALEVVIHCTCLLGACFFALPPFSGARSVICHWAPCCQHVVMVQFFSFADPFDFGYCSLAQEMCFVVHYLPYFGWSLIVLPLSAFLPFQPFVY
jgi:hypothetical protein